MPAYLRQIVLREPPNPSSYLSGLPAIRHLMGHPALTLTADVTFLVGENGSGKSTLLEAIAVACGFNAEGGSKHFNFATQETHSELHQLLTLVRGPHRERDGFFLRAESFYNVATQAENYRDGDSEETFYARYGGKALHRQSHGDQRSYDSRGNAGFFRIQVILDAVPLGDPLRIGRRQCGFFSERLCGTAL